MTRIVGLLSSSRSRTIAGNALLAGVLGYASFLLYTEYPRLSATLSDLSPSLAVASLALLAAGSLLNAWAWQLLVDDGHRPIGLPAAAPVMLLGAVAKYLPGQVWSYALQLSRGRRINLAPQRVLAASLELFGIGVVAALVLAVGYLPLVFSTPWPAVLVLAICVLALVAVLPDILGWAVGLVLRLLRQPPVRRPGWSAAVGSLLLSLLSWCSLGGHLWLLVLAFRPASVTGFLGCTTAMAVAVTFGDVLIFLPGGVGARETMLIAGLALSGVGSTTALALAAASRALFVLNDLALAALALGFERLRRPAAHEVPAARTGAGPG